MQFDHIRAIDCNIPPRPADVTREGAKIVREYEPDECDVPSVKLLTKRADREKKL